MAPVIGHQCQRETHLISTLLRNRRYCMKVRAIIMPIVLQECLHWECTLHVASWHSFNSFVNKRVPMFVVCPRALSARFGLRRLLDTCQQQFAVSLLHLAVLMVLSSTALTRTVWSIVREMRCESTAVLCFPP